MSQSSSEKHLCSMLNQLMFIVSLSCSFFSLLHPLFGCVCRIVFKISAIDCLKFPTIQNSKYPPIYNPFSFPGLLISQFVFYSVCALTLTNQSPTGISPPFPLSDVLLFPYTPIRLEF